MKNFPKDKLTMKETWTEGMFLGTLNRGQKARYKQMSIDEKRNILENYKNNRSVEIEELHEEQYETLKLEKTLNKRGLSSLSENTIKTLDKNGVGQFIDSFTTRFTHALNDPKNSNLVFIYEMINQNFALIKLLDDNYKQNETIIKQNDEIIELLKIIAKK